MNNSNWQATASPENLQLRAQLLTDLRSFFAARDVMEVETPLLSQHTVTDVHLRSFVVDNDSQALFLQTSPEYAMKRLLASGCGSIYQLGKAFRQEEQTKQHNPEFTLLEWYRVGFSLEALMDEVEELMQQLLDCNEIPRLSYASLFESHCQFNPHTISAAELEAFARNRLSLGTQELSSTDYLQLLMAQVIEPQLPTECFVYDYPKAQAALAATETLADGIEVAKRFELYCRGMELANGYFELTEAGEQSQRFQNDLDKRRSLGLPSVPRDERLLAALTAGMPSCAGVALGVDRLLMVLCEADTIEEVLSFPFDRA
ncbi:MAG: EF-P lysine aminoacylase GenX [Pseudomonadales bacterium]|nr:EF-P lysine aminoacylase GenX [Pseudomonadales bacterium]